MSHYEDALKIRDRNNRLIDALNKQVTTERRDKTGLHWQFGKVGDRCMTFSTDCYNGYYGSSSVSSNNSDELGREIAKTLTALKQSIINLTIERLERETIAAVKAAKCEAQAILDACEAEQSPREAVSP